jgi:hypothetical protein
MQELPGAPHHVRARRIAGLPLRNDVVVSAGLTLEHRHATPDRYRLVRPPLTVALATALTLHGFVAAAAPVAVRKAEGRVQTSLTLSTRDGTKLANGELIQTPGGDQVTTRLTFHFNDGSLHDETTVYTQREHFRLVSDHIVQKGPAFKRPFLESTIETASGRVKVRYTDGGKEKAIDERMELPADLANGLIPTLLKNLSPKVATATVSMLAITPKPRLVELDLAPTGEESFTTAGTTRKAVHYLVKVEIPGVTGVLANLFDKTPPDSHVWILGGDAPAFVKSESPLYVGGALWRIDVVGPVWSKK